MSTANPVPATMANGAHVAVNGSAHASTEQDGRTPPPVAAPAAPAVTKKAKRTKPPEPTDTSALIQAKIFELEKNKRGEEGETEELGKWHAALTQIGHGLAACPRRAPGHGAGGRCRRRSAARRMGCVADGRRRGPGY